jgi:large subunit ribosomal protein L19
MAGTLHEIEKAFVEELKKDYAEFRVGDTIKVTYKIIEGDKTRSHSIEGIVIKFENAMHRKTFTIRRISEGVGMEVTMPFYSPKIEKITVSAPAKRTPRRAKLYYIRERVGKAALQV